MADSTLWLYTSLTAGSSHIITATSRLETILKANKIPFKAIDVATDDKARQLWGRRSKGRRLPGLVKYNQIVGDLDQIEEWNEFGELKQQIAALSSLDDFTSTTTAAAAVTTPPANTSSKPPTPAVSTPQDTAASKELGAATKSTSPHIQIQNPPANKSDAKSDKISLALRQAGEEAALKAKENARAKLGTKPATSEADGAQPPTADPKTKGTVPLTTTDTSKTEGETAGETTKTSTTTTETEQKDTEGPLPVSEAQPSAPSNVDATQAEGGERRRSVAPEIQRPSIASEIAAVSSANFRADNAEALGLVNHHRGSIVSATTEVEKDQVARDLRSSVSKAAGEADLEDIRNLQKEGQEDSIDEDQEAEAAAEEEEEEKEEKKEETTESEAKEQGKAQAAPSTATASITQSGKESASEPPVEQDPKDGEKAGVSVED